MQAAKVAVKNMCRMSELSLMKVKRFESPNDLVERPPTVATLRAVYSSRPFQRRVRRPPADSFRLEIDNLAPHDAEELISILHLHRPNSRRPLPANGIF